jgi:enamine deaminase RidA (YjgF/YER057c/UK114 family)
VTQLKLHVPETVSAPIGGYSHAVEVRPGLRYLFVSGQVPERPDGSVPDGFEAQCHATWDNLLAVLAAADMGPADLVKVTTFLTDPAQADANGAVRRARLGRARPALTVIVARTLESPWLLEIEAVAAAPA